MVLKFHELYENVQLSKSILNKLNISLDNEDYQIIRGMLEKKPGWVGVFTKFRFEENVSVDDLALMYDRLVAMQALLPRLPVPVDKYESFEKLSDNLDTLESAHRGSKLLKELNKEQQQWLRSTGEAGLKRLEELAGPFYKLPANVQREFMSKLRTEFGGKKGAEAGMQFLAKLELYIEAQTTGWHMDLVKAQVQNTPGAVIVFEDPANDILVVELKSYKAAQALCSATRWCFRNSKSLWDSYVGWDKYTRQYTVYDFSVKLSDVHSMLGATIKQTGKFKTAHWKNDSQAEKEDLKQYYGARWQPIRARLLPMSDEEVAKRKEMVALNQRLHKLAWYYVAPEKYAEQIPVIDELYAKAKSLMEPTSWLELIMRCAVKFDYLALLKTILKEYASYLVKPFFSLRRFSFRPKKEGDSLFAFAVGNSPKVFGFMVDSGAEIPPQYYVEVAQYYSQTKNMAKLLALYEQTEEKPQLYDVLVKTRDAGVYTTLLQQATDQDAKLIAALANEYYAHMPADPALTKLVVEKGKDLDYQKTGLGIIHILARYGGDKEFEEVCYSAKELYDDENGSVAARLILLDDYEGADYLMQKAYNRIDDARKYGQQIGKKLLEHKNLKGVCYLMSKHDVRLSELTGFETLYPQLPALLRALTEQGEKLSSGIIAGATDNMLKLHDDQAEAFVRAVMPYRSQMASWDMGVFDRLSYLFGLDKQRMIEGLLDTHAKPADTFDAKTKVFHLHFKYFGDERLAALYKRPKLHEEMRNEFARREYEFDEMWEDLSDQNVQTLIKILTSRDKDVASKDDVRLLLDDATWETPRGKAKGTSVRDVLTAMTKAVGDTYEQDTLSVMYKLAMQPLHDLFKLDEAYPTQDEQGRDATVIRLTVPLSYVEQHLSVESIKKMGDTYGGLVYLLRAMFTLNGTLLDPKVSEVPRRATPETYNDMVDWRLESLLRRSRS